MSTPPSTAASRAEPMRNETPSTVAESLGPECNNLPPQTLTRLAVSTFYSCGSTLFYVMSQEVCDKLIRRVYEHPGDVNKSETCGLCALAAVGSQYSGGEIPESANKIYFEYATSWLQDTVEEDTLMGMRASICLSMYLILVKSTSARKMIGMPFPGSSLAGSSNGGGSGLNIARWSMRKCLREISQEDRLEWGRVLRTLAFVEW